MSRLNEYLTCLRDAEIFSTYYANSHIKNSICFALSTYYIDIANNNPNISAVITNAKLAKHVSSSKGLVIVDNPKKEFFLLHNQLYNNGNNNLKVDTFIDSSAQISDTAKISKNVFIGKNVIIKDYAIINKNSIILDNTYIAENVIIGARGMHNTKIDDDTFINIVDCGGVKIGKNCEILANAVIQKPYFSEFTQIANDTKISVNVNIGHGSKIGSRTLIAGNTQISGYNTIGDDVWIGPACVLAHGLKIANASSVKLGSVVVKDIHENEEVSGNFAYNHQKRVRNFIKESKL
jgi:UDP-3-O-[3-hydroxymyristoyl] glucosamine N-acyltransferase